jgi:hypothetical protein
MAELLIGITFAVKISQLYNQPNSLSLKNSFINMPSGKSFSASLADLPLYILNDQYNDIEVRKKFYFLMNKL